MISVIVTYTIKEKFLEQNKENIRKFYQEFQALDSSKFQYNVFIKDDGFTFVHHSVYKNEEIQKKLLNLPAFLEFQKQRDNSGLIEQPTIEFANLFQSSEDKWN